MSVHKSHICLLFAGKKIENKNKNELFASPQNFVTAFFISPLRIELILNIHIYIFSGELKV